MDRLIEFITNHLYLWIALMVIIVLIVQDMVEGALRKYKSATPINTVTLINQGATIIDVREPAEYAKGHIDEALGIPLDTLDKQLKQLAADKDKPIIVACNMGSRSPAACKKLIQEGFKDVYTLKGGMQAWEEENFPIKKKSKKEKNTD